MPSRSTLAAATSAILILGLQLSEHPVRPRERLLGALDSEPQQEVVEEVVSAPRVGRLDRTELVESLRGFLTVGLDVADQCLRRGEPADEELQEELLLRARLDRLEPHVERFAALGRDPVELLVRARGLDDLPPSGEAVAGKPGEHGVELALGRRPHQADRGRHPLEQVVSRLLAVERQQREDGCLGRRQRPRCRGRARAYSGVY